VYVNDTYIGDAYEWTIETETASSWDGHEYPIGRTISLEIHASTRDAARPDWDEYFMGFARAASRRGECTRRKIGAVIVRNRRVVGTGYNGARPGKKKTCLTGHCPRAQSDVAPGSSYDTGKGSCIAIHAEANALLDAGQRKCLGSVLYITDEPCEGCHKLIRAAGIARIVWPAGQKTFK
jgi:dCMP deaminase